MIEWVFAIGAIVLIVAVETYQRSAKRKQAQRQRRNAEAAEKEQRMWDLKVHAAWCAGTGDTRKKLEVRELERMMSLERKTR